MRLHETSFNPLLGLSTCLPPHLTYQPTEGRQSRPGARGSSAARPGLAQGRLPLGLLPARPFSRPLPPGARREPPHGSGCPQAPRFHSGPSAGVRGGDRRRAESPAPHTASPQAAALRWGPPPALAPRPLPPAQRGGGSWRGLLAGAPRGRCRLRWAAREEASGGRRGCAGRRKRKRRRAVARRRAPPGSGQAGSPPAYRDSTPGLSPAAPGSRDSAWAERPGSGSSRRRAGARLSWGRGRQAANPRRGASAEAAEVASA